MPENGDNELVALIIVVVIGFDDEIYCNLLLS
jgi:hypothetical protein